MRWVLSPADGWVYPRVCGGTALVSGVVAPAEGLSPRVRGNHFQRGVKGVNPRSIPACAGEPSRSWGRRTFRAVYPRVCGGTSSAILPQFAIDGLSPRVRGNRRCPGCACTGRRSIPACAGEPTSFPSASCLPPVYPRVCGGTATAVRMTGTGTGLSPRVRGNPCGGMGRSVGARSIPACAGEPRKEVFGF